MTSKKKEFYIPRIEEDDNENVEYERGKKANSNFEQFVSSYSGRNVKDTNAFPYVKYSNAGKQYDDLKDEHYKNDNIDYQNINSNYKEKKPAERIPDYLRGEIQAINRNNIRDLKGERKSNEELYQTYRANYGRYSESSNVAPKEEAPKEPEVEKVVEKVEEKPKLSREERSTLVITKRDVQPAEYFNNPYEKKYEEQNEKVEDNSRNDDYYDEKDNDYVTETVYPDNDLEITYQEEYRSSSQTTSTPSSTPKKTSQPNPRSSYNEQPRQNKPSQEEDEDKYDEKPSQNRNDEKKYVSDKFDSSRNFGKTYPQPAVKQPVEEDDDDDFDFSQDINIPLQPTEEKEIQELDAYQMDDEENEVKERPVKEVKQIPRPKKNHRKYKFPPTDLLEKSSEVVLSDNNDIDEQRTIIDSTLDEFRIGGHVVNQTKGPTVTQYEIKLDPGVKVEKVGGIAKNLQMNLAVDSIRIEAPIPGKPTVGVEVPNRNKTIVTFGDLATNNYLHDGKPLNVILGRMINGSPKYADISDMPHALIAGSTGSGKTICIYSIITSILYKATPDEVKLLLIDPKHNELMFFDGVPHLASPVIYDSKLAGAALKWAVDEMERRYDLLRISRKRNIAEYNEYAAQTSDASVSRIPYIVIVIDEFADLMSTAGDSFELNVQRLTQKARSAGIHMIIATQRPSTDVIKGTIKNNIQVRMAFSVTSQTDSFTILDHPGAEKLLGKGDMLYTKGGGDVRIQGAFISPKEIDDVVEYISSSEDEIDYMFSLDDLKKETESDEFGDGDDEKDELLPKIARHVVNHKNASTNQIIRVFGIGYNRADTIMNKLEQLGIVSAVIPGRSRTVLADVDELERILKNNYY